MNSVSTFITTRAVAYNSETLRIPFKKNIGLHGLYKSNSELGLRHFNTGIIQYTLYFFGIKYSDHNMSRYVYITGSRRELCSSQSGGRR